MANAAETMMPVAARAIAPATQPHASAPLCESAVPSCPRQDTRGSNLGSSSEPATISTRPSPAAIFAGRGTGREADQRDAVEHTVGELVHGQVPQDHRPHVERRVHSTGSGDRPRTRWVGERDRIPDVDAQPIGERPGEPHLTRLR